MIELIRNRVNKRNQNISNLAEDSKTNKNQLIIDKENYFIYDYTESLADVLRIYCPWVKSQTIERALYYYFWNLLHRANVPKFAA